MLRCMLLLLFFGEAIGVDRDTHVTDTSSFKRCTELIRRSGEVPPTKALSGFVGVGYDALRSITTLPVFEHGFSKCKVTPDGEYFIADNVEAIPVSAGQLSPSQMRLPLVRRFICWDHWRIGICLADKLSQGMLVRADSQFL